MSNPNILSLHPVGELMLQQTQAEDQTRDLYYPIYLGINIVGYSSAALKEVAETHPTITSFTTDLTIPTHHVKFPIPSLAPVQFILLCEPIPLDEYSRTRTDPNTNPHIIQHGDQPFVMKIVMQAIPSPRSNPTLLLKETEQGPPYQLAREQVEVGINDIIQVGSDLYFDVRLFDFNSTNPFSIEQSEPSDISPVDLPAALTLDKTSPSQTILDSISHQLSTQPHHFTPQYYRRLLTLRAEQSAKSEPKSNKSQQPAPNQSQPPSSSSPSVESQSVQLKNGPKSQSSKKKNSFDEESFTMNSMPPVRTRDPHENEQNKTKQAPPQDTVDEFDTFDGDTKDSMDVRFDFNSQDDFAPPPTCKAVKRESVQVVKQSSVKLDTSCNTRQSMNDMNDNEFDDEFGFDSPAKSVPNQVAIHDSDDNDQVDNMNALIEGDTTHNQQGKKIAITDESDHQDDDFDDDDMFGVPQVARTSKPSVKQNPYAAMATIPLPDDVVSSCYDSDEDEEGLHATTNPPLVQVTKTEGEHDTRHKGLKKQRTKAQSDDDDDDDDDNDDGDGDNEMVKLETPVKPLSIPGKSTKIETSSANSSMEKRPQNKRLRPSDTAISTDLDEANSQMDSLEAQETPVRVEFHVSQKSGNKHPSNAPTSSQSSSTSTPRETNTKAAFLRALSRAGSFGDLDGAIKDQLFESSSHQVTSLAYLTAAPKRASDKTTSACSVESGQDNANQVDQDHSDEDDHSQVSIGRGQRRGVQDTMNEDDLPRIETKTAAKKKGGRTATSAKGDKGQSTKAPNQDQEDQEDQEDEVDEVDDAKPLKKPSRVSRSLTTMSVRPTYEENAENNTESIAAKVKSLLGSNSSFPIILCTGLKQKYHQAQLERLHGFCFVVNEIDPSSHAHQLQVPKSAMQDVADPQFATSDSLPSVFLQSSPLYPTHIITSHYQRTAKLLLSFSCAPWILSEQWLLDSIRDGEWKAEADYVLPEDDFTKQFHFTPIESKRRDRFCTANYSPSSLFLKLNLPVISGFKHAIHEIHSKYHKKSSKLSKAQAESYSSELEEAQEQYISRLTPIQQIDFGVGALANTLVIYCSNVAGPKLHEVQAIVQSAQGFLLPLPSSSEQGVEQMNLDAFFESTYATYKPNLITPLLPFKSEAKTKPASKRGGRAAQSQDNKEDEVDTSNENAQTSLLRLALYLFTNHLTFYHHNNPTFPSNKKSKTAFSPLANYPPAPIVPCQFSTLFSQLIIQNLCPSRNTDLDCEDDSILQGIVPTHLSENSQSELNSVTQSDVIDHATRKYAQYLNTYAQFYLESVRIGNITAPPPSVKDLGKKMGQTIPNLHDWQLYNQLFAQLHGGGGAGEEMKIILVTNETKIEADFPQLLEWAFSHKIPLYTKDALLNSIMKQAPVFDQYQISIKRSHSGEFVIKAPR